MGAMFNAGRAIARSPFQPVSPAARPRAAPRATAAHAGGIVALLDASPAAANAAWRGALVARDRGLPLQLVAVQSLGADLARTAAMADATAADLRAKLHVPVTARTVAGTFDHEGVAAARDAALLVVPATSASQVLRLLRRAGRPLLAVCRPAYTSYRNVIVPVELDLSAQALVTAAAALSRDPRMKVLHVLDAADEEVMRLADVPLRAIHARRERAAQEAGARLADLIAATGAQHLGAQPVVVFGDTASQVLEQQFASAADLLVLGKRARHPLLDALRGGVSRRVLRAGRSDVLLLPLPPAAAAPRAPFAFAAGPA